METSLHRQLKQLYAGDGARVEVPVEAFRIDVVAGHELVEIQHGSLAAIRDKVHTLLQMRKYRVRVVKPIVIRKRLVKLDRRDGRVIHRRLSPRRGSVLDLFHELIYFTRVFPHPNLALEVQLVDIEEWRFPGHGRRRRRRQADHQVQDQKLLQIHGVHRFLTSADLSRLVPGRLPVPFHTGHLAESLDAPRWVAQRAAYCFRKMGTAVQIGKQGNAALYRWAAEDAPCLV